MKYPSDRSATEGPRIGTRRYAPVTPAGALLYELESSTEAGAWQNLLRETTRAQMPYKDLEALKARGYTVDTFSFPKRGTDAAGIR